jgi:general secretion pathway protein E
MNNLLLSIRTPAGVKTVPIEGHPITFGRSSENVVPLADNMVSRFHCVITPGPKGLQIKDLGSRNGTRVNDIPITAESLETGDIITLGETQITLTTDEPVAELTDDDVIEDLREKDPDERMKAALEGFDDEVLAVGAYDVEAEETVEEQGIPEDPIAHLRGKIRTFAGDSFNEMDITIINSRRQVVHASESKNRTALRDTSDTIIFYRLLLLLAFRARASDIHIEPKQDETMVRIRVDGTMIDVVRLTNPYGQKIITIAKVICDVDIAQRDKVQEGHFSCQVPRDAMDAEEGLRHVDYRCSFAPSVSGQKLVVRVLDASVAPVKIDNLGLPKWMRDTIAEAIEADSGMVLACGPTGSGKTTSLYAMLRSIDLTERNVITIEDPVEIQIPGLTQLPVKESEGKTFLNLLKTVLRQDPDVILIGEIRDNETAKTALQAAVTGHLVFSTVHTKDSVGAIFRLLDLGVEPYAIAQGLHLVLAQRLVRQLCPYCKQSAVPTEKELAQLAKVTDQPVKKVFKAKGCGQCMRTGYIGRRAVFELLSATEELRETIIHSPTASAVITSLKDTGFTKLSHNGYELVAQGLVSFDEVARAIGR